MDHTGDLWAPPPGSVLPPTPQPSGSRSRAPLVAAVVVVTLVLGVAGVFGVVAAVGRLADRSQGSGPNAAADSAGGPVTSMPIAPPVFPHSPPVGITAADKAARRGAVITPQQAATVLEKYWPVHESAQVRKDLVTLARLSTGAAEQYEVGAIACGCRRVLAERPLRDAAYFVPRQTRFPAHFVVQALTTTLSGERPWVELLVFSRRGPTAPWLVSEDSGFGPMDGDTPRLGVPDVGAGGFTRPVSAAHRARARALTHELAALWQQAKNTASVPRTTTFSLRGQPGDLLRRLAAARQDAIQTNGLHGHFEFAVRDSDPLVVVPDADGYDLACMPIRELKVYTAPAGSTVYQDPGLSNWGPQLPAGRYRSVTFHEAWQTCLGIPHGPLTQVGIFNEDDAGGTPVGRR
jgi:hypothetical protein